MVLVEGQDTPGPGVGTLVGGNPPTPPLPAPPRPLPWKGRGSWVPAPWGGGCALISFLPCCCTWVNVRVCYLHKELPSPQRLPPPSWGTGDPPLPCTSPPLPPPAPWHGPALCCMAPARVCVSPSSTGARAWGRSLMGWGAAASGHRMYSAAGRGTGTSSTCRYTGAGPGGALPPPAPCHPLSCGGGPERGTSGPGASPAATWGPPVPGWQGCPGLLPAAPPVPSPPSRPGGMGLAPQQANSSKAPRAG